MLARRSMAPVAFVLATALVAPPATAHAEPAQDPVDLIRQGRHLEAAEAFERSYARSGDPALLFAKATALRRGGDCGRAIEELERFIATDPPESDVVAAQEVIDVCTEILDDGGAPAPPPPVLPEPALISEVEAVEGPQPKSWTRDIPGGVLLGTGVAVAVGGVVLLGLGAARTQSREESEAGFERREQSVRMFSAAGGSMVAAGTALLIGSIVRYAVVARRNERR